MGRPSKRADILRAGVQVLHRRGYGMASVEDITQAAGVPKGSFFNHFGSKEEFAREALAAYFLPWTEKSEAVLASADLDAKQKLSALLAIAPGKARGSYNGCLIGNMSLELANESEPVRDAIALILASWGASFERVIREGQKSGIFNKKLSPGKTARFIVNFFQGSVLRAKVDRSDAATKEFKEVVFAALLV